jgi:hypothetical protein
VSWLVNVTAIPEVSDDPIHEMTVRRNPSTAASVDLRFEDVGSTHYNLYVSKTPFTSPFRVSDPSQGKIGCALAGVTSIGGGLHEVTGYDLDEGLTGDTSLLYFLVTADNGPPTEGSLGAQFIPPAAPAARTADSYCGR